MIKENTSKIFLNSNTSTGHATPRISPKTVVFVRFQPISRQYSFHIQTSQLICIANQLTGFYMKGTYTGNWVSSLET